MASRKRADPRFRIAEIYPSVNLGKINKTIAKRNGTYNSSPNITQKRKELERETPLTARMNSYVPEGYVVPALLVGPAVLRMLEIR